MFLKRADVGNVQEELQTEAGGLLPLFPVTLAKSLCLMTQGLQVKRMKSNGRYDPNEHFVVILGGLKSVPGRKWKLSIRSLILGASFSLWAPSQLPTSP